MTAIAIFVKTPGYSAVKTRLAARVGRQRAESWHLEAARTVARLAERADIGPVYWAVAEVEAMDHVAWQGLPRLDQGEGGLGQRMSRIHARLVETHGSGLLLGADTVQWQPAWLRQAAEWLSVTPPRLCLGPARDGGFWMFGANRILRQQCWLVPEYSRSDTRRQFVAAMAGCGEWLNLPTLTDLDQLEDVDAVLAELERPDSRPYEYIEIKRLLNELRETLI